MPSPRLEMKRQMRLDAGRRAFQLIAQGVPMNAIVAELCSAIGPFKENRSRTWLYCAMEEADKTDKTCHNVTSQSDTNCHDAVPDIDSDPLVQ